MVQAAAAQQQPPMSPSNMMQRNQQASAAAAQQNPCNVTVQPRFLFGLKNDVKNNVLYLEDNILCYPCGHNVVVHYID